MDGVRRLDEDCVARGDFESGELPGCGNVVGSAFGYPTGEGAVFPGVCLETLAAFVGELGGGFKEDEAFFWSAEVDAAIELILDESHVIEIAAFATQGEFKAGFAVGIAVATTSIAAGLREDRHDVVPEGNVLFGTRGTNQENCAGKIEDESKVPHGFMDSYILACGGTKPKGFSLLV